MTIVNSNLPEVRCANPRCRTTAIVGSWFKRPWFCVTACEIEALRAERDRYREALEQVATLSAPEPSSSAWAHSIATTALGITTP